MTSLKERIAKFEAAFHPFDAVKIDELGDTLGTRGLPCDMWGCLHQHLRLHPKIQTLREGVVSNNKK